MSREFVRLVRGPMIPLRIEDTVLLENFCDNWDGGVYRVRNHENKSLRAVQSDPCGKIANDTGVDLAGERVSISINVGVDRWTDLKQIVSEIVVDVSVIIIIVGDHASLVIYQVSGNEGESWGQVKIIAYPWLPWNTSRNDYNFSPSQGFLEAIIRGKEPLDLRLGVNVRKVCSNTRGVDDIVEAELCTQDQGGITGTMSTRIPR